MSQCWDTSRQHLHATFICRYKTPDWLVHPKKTYMSKELKIQVDAFLLRLAYELVVHSYFGFSKEISRLALIQHIYDRHKSKDPEYIHSTYSSPRKLRDSLAYSKAERIKTYFIYDLEECRFTKYILDCLVQEIFVLGSFNTWDEFVARFEQEKFSQISKRRFNGKAYSQLSKEERELIDWQVDKLIRRLEQERKTANAKTNHHIVFQSNDELIRTITEYELSEASLLSSTLNPYPLVSMETRRKWHSKNSHIYYCYFTDAGIVGGIGAVPMRKHDFDYYREHGLNANDISTADIPAFTERDATYAVYLKELYYTERQVLKRMLISFPLIIEQIASITSNEVIVFSDVRTKEGKEILRDLGFKKTCSVKNPVTNEFYEFYESSWKELRPNLFTKNFDGYDWDVFNGGTFQII